MRRFPLFLGLGLLGLFIGGTLLALALLLQHEPAFYGRAAVAPGPMRQQQSNAFSKEFWRLVNEAGTARLPTWHVQFTETQINSFFEEELVAAGYADKLLPDGVYEPRITIEQDRFRLGFRYGQPPWSTIVSLDFKVWLAPKERNVVILQLQGLHAGALPISAQSLLEKVSETLRKNNINVTWFRHEGRPTAVVSFQSNQARPSVLLQQLELRNGTLSVVGSCPDAVAPPGPVVPAKTAALPRVENGLK